MKRLLLVIVAYRTSLERVERLRECLECLRPDIGYAIASNSHDINGPVNLLRNGAEMFQANTKNLGYGRAFNNIVRSLDSTPEYIAILNDDVWWDNTTIESILDWLIDHAAVVVASPRILNEAKSVNYLCKHHPTILALLSRRFLPDWLKPDKIKKYDQWFTMSSYDYDKVFSVQYLSGCCMFFSTKALFKAGLFDERYFLYLEDADITRSMATYGDAVHLGIFSIYHSWGRGSHKTLMLTLVNIQSSIKYFRKWGIKLF